MEDSVKSVEQELTKWGTRLSNEYGAQNTDLLVYNMFDVGADDQLKQTIRNLVARLLMVTDVYAKPETSVQYERFLVAMFGKISNYIPVYLENQDLVEG